VSYAPRKGDSAYGLTHSLLAWSVGKGGTLTATCRLPDIS
jgi:hypothetical protein